MAEAKRLPQSFFEAADVVQTARNLLGKILCSRIDGSLVKARILETEAYDTPHDKACHAYGHRRTNRTETLYLAGGHSYVYLCYGIHHLFNVVTGPAEHGQAVLVRAVLPVEGIDIVRHRRKKPDAAVHRLAAGPGSVGQAMGFHTKKHNGLNLVDSNSLIWIENHNIDPGTIFSGPRIGVDYAEECALWPWRFWTKP